MTDRKKIILIKQLSVPSKKERKYIFFFLDYNDNFFFKYFTYFKYKNINKYI